MLDALDAAVPSTNGAQHHPGLAPKGIRPPSWWKGDKAAFRSSTRAMDEVNRRPKAGVR